MRKLMMAGTLILTLASAQAQAETTGGKPTVTIRNSELSNTTKVNGVVANSAIGDNNRLDTNLGLRFEGANLDSVHATNKTTVNGAVTNTAVGNGNHSTLNLGISATSGQ